jgi:hypothetical protein
MKMKILLVLACFAGLSPALEADVVILFQGITKVGCGSAEKSLPPTIKKALKKDLSAEIKSLQMALKATGVTQYKMEVVDPGKSYAIAVVRKKHGQCEWETYIWRTAAKGGVPEATRLVKSAAEGEPGKIDFSVEGAEAVD